jgi:transcription elongation factor S-II
MSEVVELKKLVKQLQSAANEQETLSVLALLKEKNVTEGILRESKAGLAVGKLRTSQWKNVADVAKEIVKQWKTEVDRAKGFQAKKAATPITPTGSTAKLNTSSARSAKADGVKGGTGDSTRDKCVELVYDALVADTTAPTELVLSLSRAVEKAVLELTGDDTTAEYKSKIRSLFVNLKDKANPALRASIVDGSLAPEKFAKMTSQEMASAERQAENRKIEEDNLFKSLSAAEKQAETEAFQCSRCKQRKCVYRQAQTRSADEPMTTFVTCTVCGNRWKFS